MPRLLTAALLAPAFLLAAVPSGQAAGRPPVSLQIAVGYQSVYRDSAWTPVRVTLRNSSSANLSGTLQIPASSNTPSLGASQSFHGLYQTPVVLPAGGTKRLTVYLPGSAVQGQVNATFLAGKKPLAQGSAFAMGTDSSTLLIGVLSRSPADFQWIAPAIQGQVTTRVVRLGAGTLDPVPEALATFDLIVLSDFDSSQLDASQQLALQSYVQQGGALLLVGGPTWQETLRPLWAPLLPGRLAGTRVLSDLHALQSLGAPARPTGPQKAAVSVLAHPAGAVLAAQAGVPLVVRRIVGQGAVEYLAFDPSLSPVAAWGSAPVLQRVLSSAAPLAISRTWSPVGFRARFQRALSSIAVTSELSNLDSAGWPLLPLFAVLTLLYLFLLGPANFLVLRALGHQALAWITVPILAVMYLASAYGLVAHLRGNAALLNSVGLVALQDGSQTHPATIYMGLLAPLPGSYHLTYRAATLPAPVPQLDHFGFNWRQAAPPTNTPLGLTLQEGGNTQVTFVSMKQWATRSLTLATTVHVAGAVRSALHLDAHGAIVGPIHNGTALSLLDPVVVAGQTVAHLPTIPAGSTIQIRVQPSSASYSGGSSVWTHLYGGSDLGGDGGFFFHFGGFDAQSSLPVEKTLADRVQNAASMLGQVAPLSSFGQVALVGWTQQPLGTVSVDGASPQQRALTMLVVPLSLHLPPRGLFVLRSGAIGPHLVDIVPQAPSSSCCGFFSRSGQPVSVGAGGALTFEFDLPRARHVRFQSLSVGVNGDESSGSGSVYDWHQKRWIGVDLSSNEAALSQPGRFVSAGGRLLLRVQATSSSGDITIDDPSQDVQIWGRGSVA